MSDRPGDPALEPPECGYQSDPPPRVPGTALCPHIRTVHQDCGTETRGCDVCGRWFTLYDDEMR